MTKVVSITGAAQGIGLEIARQFAREGATTVISDVNPEALSTAASDFEKEHLHATFVQLDVTNESEVRTSFEETIASKGRIDVLINNAGLQHIDLIDEYPTEKFEQLIRVMLIAPFLAIKHVFPIMKRQMSGRIINMASVNGLIGFAGKAAYNSAKHGVIGLTKVAALEGAAFNITVNALCPGYVDTQLVRQQLATLAHMRNTTVEKVLEEVIFALVPQKRLLSSEEIAHYALFLAGDKVPGITGQALVIDGGYTAQ